MPAQSATPVHPLAPAVVGTTVSVTLRVGVIRAQLLDVTDRFVVLGDPALGLYAEVPHGLIVDIEHLPLGLDHRGKPRRMGDFRDMA